MLAHFGQRLGHRLAEDVALADKIEVRDVRKFEHMQGATQHRHEARRLLKKIAEELVARGESVGCSSRELAQLLGLDQIACAHEKVLLRERLRHEVLCPVCQQAVL
ncbi:MAG TPA: hypothetical protein VHQ87_03290, partial [Rhizobacter sp.]|nr:hypothetical protein [Rhizobacter sp.]